MFILDDTLVVTAVEVAHPEYEYRIVNRCLSDNGKMVKTRLPPITEEELNKYGQKGWQLCGIATCYYRKITHLQYDIPDGQLFFRRLKSAKQTPSG
jgi:hypothetical protein